MKKEAYFRMMGLDKFAAEKSVGEHVGEAFGKVKKGVEQAVNTAKSLPEALKEKATEPFENAAEGTKGFVNNLRKGYQKATGEGHRKAMQLSVATREAAKKAQKEAQRLEREWRDTYKGHLGAASQALKDYDSNKLGFWSYLWNYIKSLFGSKQGANALKADEDLQTQLNSAYGNFINFTRKDEGEALKQIARHAVRQTKADAIIRQLKASNPELPKSEFQKYRQYIMDKGAENSKQDYSVPVERPMLSAPLNTHAEQHENSFAYNPTSYSSQLMA